MTAVAMVVGLLVAFAAGRRPAHGVLVLIALLPFDLYGSSLLYRLGLPLSVMRPLRFWPEAIMVGLAVAALIGQRRSGWRFDALDWVAIAYVALGTVYALVPRLVVPGTIGAGLGLSARELGWRTDVLYIAALVLARRLPLTPDHKRRLLVLTVSIGTVIAGLGLFEFVDSSAWNRLAVRVFEVPRYQAYVLHAVPGGVTSNNVLTFDRVAGQRVVRVGSVLNYETLAFYLAMCVGFGAELLVRGQTRAGRARWLLPGAIVVLLVGDLVTETRSGILAAFVALALAAGARAGRSQGQRRVLLGIGAGILVAALATVSLTGEGNRLLGDQTSDSAHTSSLHQGLNTMTGHPLGVGLATAAGGGQIAAAQGRGTAVIISEDQWLQIGTQLGFAGLGLYLLTLLLALLQLYRGPTSSSLPAAATRTALVALLVGGLFLQPFIDSSVSLTLFLLIGLAAGMPSVRTPTPQPAAA